MCVFKSLTMSLSVISSYPRLPSGLTYNIFFAVKNTMACLESCSYLSIFVMKCSGLFSNKLAESGLLYDFNCELVVGENPKYLLLLSRIRKFVFTL